MPRTLRDILDHADELADRFEAYEPRAEDKIGVATFVALREAASARAPRSPDPGAAVDFYGALFGWEFEDRMPADAPGRHVVCRLGGRDVAAVSSRPAGSTSVPVWNTYIAVERDDDTAAQVRNAGGRMLTEPTDLVDAERWAACADPSGAVFRLWRGRNHHGAEAVNEPGAWNWNWNWSDLNTRDLDAAEIFYGSVSGWRPRPWTWGSASRLWCGSRVTPTPPAVRSRAAEPTCRVWRTAWLLGVHRMDATHYERPVRRRRAVTLERDVLGGRHRCDCGNRG